MSPNISICSCSAAISFCSSIAELTPIIADKRAVTPVIAAVTGLDNPINFNAVAAAPAPTAIFPSEETRSLLPDAIS